MVKTLVRPLLHGICLIVFINAFSIDSNKVNAILKREIGNQNNNAVTNNPNNNQNGSIVAADIVLYGVRVEGSEDLQESFTDIPKIQGGSNIHIELFASGLTPTSHLGLSENNETCSGFLTKPIQVLNDSLTPRTGEILVHVPDTVQPGSIYYFCVKTSDQSQWRHLGGDVSIGIAEGGKVPFWLELLIMILCLTISFIFSALNLGLMALDVNELNMLISSGTNVEKKYAKTILPVRRNGNYLLCSILLCLTFVNAIFTTILDSLTSGPVAVAGTTITLVIIGEILPQSIGSRYGLAIGAHTIYLTRIAMIITFPISYPMGKLLDKVLGDEIGSIKTRENLKALVMATSNLVALKKDEVNIISGALEMTRKRVDEIMTKIDDCYMLDLETILNFEVISEIVRTGYSRVPVYIEDRTKIHSVLFTKDLAVIDPDDNIPLKTLCNFVPYEIFYVSDDTTVDILFHSFKNGIKGHMAFIRKRDEITDNEITVGLVTLEDVIEEIIQAEINDESDMYEDNRSSRRRTHRRLMQEFMKYSENFGKQQVRVSPQLILAAYQFLSTGVQPFLPEYISPTVLWRMLQYDIYCHIKPKASDGTEESVIYQEGKSADYFVMILEGRVTVKVGIEQLEFESGPFTCFGTHALIKEMGGENPLSLSTSQIDNRLRVGSIGTITENIGFFPDYTVIAKTELYYLAIKRDLYAAGRNATHIERSREKKKRGETPSIPASPSLPRDEKYSALYSVANSMENLTTPERSDSKRIKFKDEETSVNSHDSKHTNSQDPTGNS